MKLSDVNPDILKKESDKALLNTHFHFTMLYQLWKRGEKGLDVQALKKAHDMVVDELDRRGVSKKALHTTPTVVKEDLAPVLPSGEDSGKGRITLGDLPDFKDFYLDDVFVYLIGQMVEGGSSINDVDFLIKWPQETPDILKIPVDFRLARQFSPEMRDRLHFCYDQYHAPFTSCIPLYRLKVERINPQMIPIMAGKKREEKETAYAQAEISEKQDKIEPLRFFYPQKTGHPAIVVSKEFKGKWNIPEVVETMKSKLPLVVEKKYDGMRAVIFKDKDKVAIITDGGSNITDRLPKTIEELKNFPEQVVMDSELEYWLDSKHQPREEVASTLMGGEALDEDFVTLNVFDLLFLDGKDLHIQPASERRKTLEGLPFKQSELEWKKSNAHLNLIPSMEVKTEKELEDALRIVTTAKASEGSVLRKPDVGYVLTGTTPKMWKAKKYASLNVIVWKRNETATPGTYNYNYAISVPVSKFDPKSSVDIKGEKFSKAGTSYATTEKLDEGNVFKLFFHTFNLYTDPDTGLVSGHFYEPVYGGKQAVVQPDSIDTAEKIASDAGLLSYKAGQQSFREAVQTLWVSFLGTKGHIEEETPQHKMHTAVLLNYSGHSGLLDFGKLWQGKFQKLVSGVRPSWIALTHAHPDHVGGLEGEEIDIPVYMTEETDKLLAPDKYKIKTRIILKPHTKVKIDDSVSIQAVPVSHSVVAPATGFKFYVESDDGREYVIGFFPDMLEIDTVELEGIDVYVGDGASPFRSILRHVTDGMEDVGHASMTQQLNWLVQAGVHTAIFIHRGRQSLVIPDQKLIDILKEKGFNNKEIILPDDGETISITDHAVKDALYLSIPHGELIWNGDKTLIVKSKKFNVAGKTYFLASDLVYGAIRLKEPYQISLEEFEVLRSKHRISEAERMNWWPNTTTFWAYEIEDFFPWKHPRKYQYVKGVQTFIRDLKLLESLSYTMLIAKGGADSGNIGHFGRIGEVGGSTSSPTTSTEIRSLAAKKSYNPATREKQLIATAKEKEVAKHLGGKHMLDNEPFDVLHTDKGIGIEVKTIVAGKNPKITMHPDSLRRKIEFAKKNKLKAVWTIVHDVRGGAKDLYVKKGVGSFNLSAMTKVTPKELKGLIGV
jgi:phosphoribosyl 1,2-cyclic phosphodiesterase